MTAWDFKALASVTIALATTSVLAQTVIIGDEPTVVREAAIRESDADFNEPLQLTSQHTMVPIPGKTYAICKFEVTQALWKKVMGSNPSSYSHTGDSLPVENVSWNDCQKFLAKLNVMPEFKEPGFVYRLPTADEWEFACRAGAKGDFCLLDDGTEITQNTLGEVA